MELKPAGCINGHEFKSRGLGYPCPTCMRPTAWIKENGPLNVQVTSIDASQDDERLANSPVNALGLIEEMKEE